MIQKPAPAGTWIITPGHMGARFPAAHSCRADVALVDLEDSVPDAAKPEARQTARAFFTNPPTRPLLGVRISSPTTRDGIRDLAALHGYPVKPQVVLIPKVESARDFEIVAGALDTHDYAPLLYALIETPRALEALPSIMRADRIAGVLFGTADYATATRCSRTWEPLLHARAALVTSAAAAGIPAIDSPFFDLDDLDGLQQEAERVKALGFTGKSCVHPAHLPVIDKVFRPAQEEIAAARAIVAAAENAGGSIVRVDGRMTGPPMVAAARALLAREETRTPSETPV
ncbi:HpcH/HpaI aldolase/citrate lyase family protein [Streptomyces sp. NEAU-Y11]|uniref:HpcH/HpaI aldolase/citrate lyase family protein n=1 Tax=Streptomyces cucumeris TaxID=2962890 RepID=UPI0020C8971E|nr:aldolase/citrate lyase family protein [Streptomyces sp. NEAU-Y11]MCP9211456.1 CoA ester lyase [Streptomyces sp. NEAU-Y11]